MRQKVLPSVTVAEVWFWRAKCVHSYTQVLLKCNSFTWSLAESTPNKHKGILRNVLQSDLQMYTLITQEAFCFFYLLLVSHSGQDPTCFYFLAKTLSDQSRASIVQLPFTDKAAQCCYHSKEVLTNFSAGNNKRPKRRKPWRRTREVVFTCTHTNLPGREPQAFQPWPSLTLGGGVVLQHPV